MRLAAIFRLATTAILATAAILTTLTACNPDTTGPTPNPGTTPASASPTPAPTPTPTPTPSPTPVDPKTAAIKAIVGLNKVLDKVDQGKAPISDLAKWTHGQQLAVYENTIRSHQRNGWRQVGSRVVDSPVVTGVSRDSSKLVVVNVTACIDVTAVDVVDKSGKSVVSPDRLPRIQTRFGVTEISPGLWRVTDASNKGRVRC